ncbi:hypothetical protein QBC40DRAFT_224795 [Triangularia verruculosa]|uniref:Uncharacterized protein n=1 Tax=Triangularia verruculosa TaxID=2587418 RepID=A0AAN6XLU2_9PEZI|nr:hypothetical protein QBC40DRAFT_224795 [Triangularia verruculosa]
MSSIGLPLDEDAPTGALAWYASLPFLQTPVGGVTNLGTQRFPWGRQDLPGWRFDVITLLAIIGESSVAEHAQTLTASRLCLLPRIIPAPQALLKPVRPQRLPEANAKMAGVHSGVVLDTVGFFANILHPLDEMKAFSFKVLQIEHSEQAKQAIKAGKKERVDTSTNGTGGWWKRWKQRNSTRHQKPTSGTTVLTPSRPGFFDTDPADTTGKSRRKSTVHFTSADNDLERGSSSTLAPTPARDRPSLHHQRTSTIKPSVPATFYSPVHLLSILSFALTLLIIILSAYWEDGTAILATVMISLASSVVCYASLWKPVLMNRTTRSQVPEGDVVIRTREGAFLLIKCTEEVARELYSGTEECKYVVASDLYRVYMGLGMVLLMVSVVLLGNCEWNSQVLIGGSYILLNGLYWMMGLLKEERFWDLKKRYSVKDVTPVDSKEAHLMPAKYRKEEYMDRDHKGEDGDDDDEKPSFTRTMWYAIRETKDKTEWVKKSGAMPVTDSWLQWLDEAMDKAMKGEREWKAVKRKNEIMARSVGEKAAQQAPAQVVQRSPTMQG